MSKVCDICGKGKVVGGCITRRGLSKKSGGIGLHVVKNVKRTFSANIQSIRVDDGGSVRTINACTACIRTGNFKKA